MEDAAKSRRRQKIKDYIDTTSKSPVAGVIYALFSGPFGCAYANPRSTVVTLYLAVAVGLQLVLCNNSAIRAFSPYPDDTNPACR